MCSFCGKYGVKSKGVTFFPHPDYECWSCENCIADDEIQVAIRDLEGEWMDGLISQEAYLIRKAELLELISEESCGACGLLVDDLEAHFQECDLNPENEEAK
jgi:hypothetical protein